MEVPEDTDNPPIGSAERGPRPLVALVSPQRWRWGGAGAGGGQDTPGGWESQVFLQLHVPFRDPKPARPLLLNVDCNFTSEETRC